MSITVNIQIQGFGERLELGPMSAQREQPLSWPPAKSPGQCARNKERTKDGTECLLPESRSPCKRRQEGLEKKELLPRGDCFQTGAVVRVAHASGPDSQEMSAEKGVSGLVGKDICV